MTLPYGVISDPHYHRWDAFATTNADGLNSRLEIQLDATKEAAKAMKAAGCKHRYCSPVQPGVAHDAIAHGHQWRR